MKKYLILSLIIFCQVEIYAVSTLPSEIKFGHTADKHFTLRFSDASSDESENDRSIENPFKDTRWDWFSEKYRAEKIILSAGIVSIVIGTPIFVVGIFEYLLPQSDKSAVAGTAYISLMGIGSGIMAVGITLTITGAVRLNLLQARDKLEISLSIDIYTQNY